MSNCQICDKEAEYSTLVFNHVTNIVETKLLCNDCFSIEKHNAVKIDNTDNDKENFACMCTHKANADIRSRRHNIIYVKYYDIECIDMSHIDDTVLCFFNAEEEHISLRHKFYTLYLRH